jgi:hypothetical protein
MRDMIAFNQWGDRCGITGGILRNCAENVQYVREIAEVYAALGGQLFAPNRWDAEKSEESMGRPGMGQADPVMHLEWPGAISD